MSTTHHSAGVSENLSRSRPGAALARASLMAFVALGLSGCTLAQLWDFPLGECASDAECAQALNAQGGFPATCRAYACRANDTGRSVCVRLEDRETCDGADNDCDGVVDERTSAGEVIAPEAVQLTTGQAATVATDRDAQHVVWTYFDETAFIGETSADAAPQQVHYVTYASTSPTGGTLTNAADDTCVRGGTTGPCQPTDVRIERFTLTEGGTPRDLLVHAWVDVTACSSGLLRVGVADIDAPDTVYAVGPLRRSNSHAGLLTVLDRCSANATAACQAAITDGDLSAVNATCGATKPAIVALPGTDQGVLAFTGAPTFDVSELASTGRPSCGGDAVEVQVFGLFARSSFSGIPDRVEVSGEGTPTTLGQTTGGGRPGLAADRAAGTFVAYGDANGELALHYVPRQGQPPANDGRYIDGDPDSRVGVEIPGLSGVQLLTTLEGAGGRVDDVALVVGQVDVSGGTLTLGATWREGNVLEGGDCVNASRIYFRRILVPLDSEGAVDPSGAIQASEPILVSRGAPADLGAPGIAYVPSLVTSDFTRAGTVVGSQTGGFVVAWYDRPTRLLRARRVLEVDGLPLDSDCAERGCAPEDIQMAVDNAVDLAIAPDAMQRVVAFVARGGAGGESGALSCLP